MEASIQPLMFTTSFACYVGEQDTSTWAETLQFGALSLLGIQHLASSIIIEDVVQLS